MPQSHLFKEYKPCGFNGILKMHNFLQFYKLQIPKDINKRGVKREQSLIFYGFHRFVLSFCSLLTLIFIVFL